MKVKHKLSLILKLNRSNMICNQHIHVSVSMNVICILEYNSSLQGFNYDLILISGHSTQVLLQQ
jgi:uncharacterized membrane protein YwzB